MFKTDTQLSLSEIMGPIKDLLEKLNGEKGSEWLVGLNRFLRKESNHPSQHTLLSKNFKPVRRVKVPALGQFIARDHFRLNSSSVKISHMDAGFSRLISDKVENFHSKPLLKGYSLANSLSIYDVVAGLGINYITSLS